MIMCEIFYSLLLHSTLSASLSLTHIINIHRIAMGRICSKFKELFVEIRERASKALFFAKMLSKVRSKYFKEGLKNLNYC